VCPHKSNKSGGVDVHAVKSYDAAACDQQTQQAPKIEQQPTVELQPTVEQQQEVAVQAAAPKQQGGVLGAQAGRPAAGQQDQGGVLGEIGAVTQSELPFMGFRFGLRSSRAPRW
jgi:hypothetical protein